MVLWQLYGEEITDEEDNGDIRLANFQEHGGKRASEGPMADLGENARIAVVDDACTTASSLFLAIDAVEAAGHQVVKVITILDRNEGGSDKLRSRGYDFVALLSANEKGEIIPLN